MKNIWIFTFGAFGYGTLEVIWRGYTHWSMALAGGLVLLILYRFTSDGKYGVLLCCALSCAVITLTELVFGFVFNIILKMNVWDYSYLPFDFFGQICLPYTLLWFSLGFPLFYICRGIKRIWRQHF